MADASETGAQHIGTFWMLELDRPLPPAIIPRVPAAFMRTGPEAAQELAQAMGFDNPEIVLQRLSAGRHCYTVRVDGSLAAYSRVTFDEEAAATHIVIRKDGTPNGMGMKHCAGLQVPDDCEME